MNARAHKDHLTFAVALLTLASPLLAWADCTDTRKATAAEIDFFNRGTAALAALLPPVPVGAELRSSDSPHTIAGSNQCVGQTGNFTVEVSRNYAHNLRSATVSIEMNVPTWSSSPNAPSATSATYGPLGRAGLKVNNIRWSVGGYDTPLRKTLADAIDRERLQGLVGKPLPSIAESQALAAQAVPATIAAAPVAAPAAAAGPAPATQSAARPGAAQPAGQPPASDPARDAVDTVNRLRGLFGR